MKLSRFAGPTLVVVLGCGAMVAQQSSSSHASSETTKKHETSSSTNQHSKKHREHTAHGGGLQGTRKASPAAGHSAGPKT